MKSVSAVYLAESIPLCMHTSIPQGSMHHSIAILSDNTFLVCCFNARIHTKLFCFSINTRCYSAEPSVLVSDLFDRFCLHVKSDISKYRANHLIVVERVEKAPLDDC